MSLFYIIGIAVGLAMDAFAAAVSCGIALRAVSPRQVLRLAFHFGLFQGAMPIIGWAAGSGAHRYIAAVDHWVAFGLLAFIGLRAIVHAVEERSHDYGDSDPTRGASLALLSVATSIDALAVGVSLAALQVSIWFPAVIIAVITAALTAVGMMLGERIGTRFGRGIEVAGGLILLGIGLKILLSHTLFA